jgi:predicted RNA-binding protein YlxR (DUF448 family)
VPLLRLKQRTLQQQLALVEEQLHSRSAYIEEAVRGAGYDDYLRHRQARAAYVAPACAVCGR